MEMQTVCPVCPILTVNELTVQMVDLTHHLMRLQKGKNDFPSSISMTSIQNNIKYDHVVCQNSNLIDSWSHGELKEMQRNIDHIFGQNPLL